MNKFFVTLILALSSFISESHATALTNYQKCISTSTTLILLHKDNSIDLSKLTLKPLSFWLKLRESFVFQLISEARKAGLSQNDAERLTIPAVNEGNQVFLDAVMNKAAIDRNQFALEIANCLNLYEK